MENRRLHQTTSSEGKMWTATHWSVVLEAKDHSMEALDALCTTYRSPLIVWLRSRGETIEDAEDLAQGFFEQLLRRDGLQRVGPEKGRFRTFLRAAFRNYAADQHKRLRAAKRGAGQAVASLDESTEGGGPLLEPVSGQASPDQAYDRAWAETLLARALHRLEAESAASGHAALCAALEPVVFRGEDTSSYAAIAQQLGISEPAVKMAASRMRKRLRALFREEVGQTVANAGDLEDELRYLLSLFGRSLPSR